MATSGVREGLFLGSWFVSSAIFLAGARPQGRPLGSFSNDDGSEKVKRIHVFSNVVAIIPTRFKCQM